MGKPHIVVTTPCYDGVTPGYMISVMKLKDACQARGIDFTCHLVPNVALITFARAKLVSDFLNFSGATHMLSIDSDISFEPQQAFRLLDFGVDFAGAVYPAKHIDWSRATAAIEGGAANVESSALDYLLAWDDPSKIESIGSFARVTAIGAGFMLVRREALIRLCDAHPELRFKRVPENGDDRSFESWALFDPMISADGRYVGEDHAFCRRWRAIGGDIWVDLESRLDHTGTYTFRGDLSTRIKPITGNRLAR